MPFGAGPSGSVPFGGLPDADQQLVGFQIATSLGVLGEVVEFPLAGFQPLVSVGVLSPSVQRSIDGFLIPVSLGVLPENISDALSGFDITSHLGVLGFAIDNNPTLAGFNIEVSLGVLRAASIRKLVRMTLGDRSTFPASLSDSLETRTSVEDE